MEEKQSAKRVGNNPPFNRCFQEFNVPERLRNKTDTERGGGWWKGRKRKKKNEGLRHALVCSSSIGYIVGTQTDVSVLLEGIGESFSGLLKTRPILIRGCTDGYAPMGSPLFLPFCTVLRCGARQRERNVYVDVVRV